MACRDLWPARCPIVIKPPVSEIEPLRLEALRSYAILDSAPEPDYDGLAALAAQLCHAPMALVSLVDAQRQWCKAKVGIDANEIPRDLGFCAHAIVGAEPLIVEDTTRDERFRDNPLVTGAPNIRFYAGFPLLNPDGFVLGTLCILDRSPRTIRPEQVTALKTLARQVVALLELRRQTELARAAGSDSGMTQRELREAAARYNAVFSSNFIAASVVSLPDRIYIDCNQAFLDLIGCKRQQIIGRSVAEVGIVIGYDDQSEIRTDLYSSGAVQDRGVEITVRGQRRRLLYSAVVVSVDGRLSVLSYMRDVTAFQRMVDQIRESEGRFKRVFHSSPDPIAILSGPGFRVVDVNEAVIALVGYSRDELIGKLPAELGLVPDLAGSLQGGDAALLGGALRNQEVNLCTRHGETVTVLCSVVAVELDRQPSLLTFMRDITARKRVEQQIADLNRALHNQTTLLHSILLSLGEAVIVSGAERWGRTIQPGGRNGCFGSDLIGGGTRRLDCAFSGVS